VKSWHEKALATAVPDEKIAAPIWDWRPQCAQRSL